MLESSENYPEFAFPNLVDILAGIRKKKGESTEIFDILKTSL